MDAGEELGPFDLVLVLERLAHQRVYNQAPIRAFGHERAPLQPGPADVARAAEKGIGEIEEQPLRETLGIARDEELPPLALGEVVEEALAHLRGRAAEILRSRRLAGVAHVLVERDGEIEMVRQPLGGGGDAGADGVLGDRHLGEKAVRVFVRECAEQVLVEDFLPAVVELGPAQPVAAEDQDQRAGGLAHQRLEPGIAAQFAAPELLVGVDGDHDPRTANLGAGAPDVEAQVLRQALGELRRRELVETGKLSLHGLARPPVAEATGQAGAILVEQIQSRHGERDPLDGDIDTRFRPVEHVVDDLALAAAVEMGMDLADILAGPLEREMAREGQIEGREAHAASGEIAANLEHRVLQPAVSRHVEVEPGERHVGIASDPTADLVMQARLALAAHAVPADHPVIVTLLALGEGLLEESDGFLAVGEDALRLERLLAVGMEGHEIRSRAAMRAAWQDPLWGSRKPSHSRLFGLRIMTF